MEKRVLKMAAPTKQSPRKGAYLYQNAKGINTRGGNSKEGHEKKKKTHIQKKKSPSGRPREFRFIRRGGVKRKYGRKENSTRGEGGKEKKPGKDINQRTADILVAGRKKAL